MGRGQTFRVLGVFLYSALKVRAMFRSPSMPDRREASVVRPCQLWSPPSRLAAAVTAAPSRTQQPPAMTEETVQKDRPLCTINR